MAYEQSHDTLVLLGNTPVAGQQDALLEVDGDAIETTTKSDFPHKSFIGGGYGWRVRCAGLVELSDPGLAAVEAAALSRAPVTVKVKVGARTYTGPALVTYFAYHAPMTKAVSALCVLQGAGALGVGS